MKKKIESQNVEFKSNWRDEYLKVFCAFANANGGVLLLGLDDDGKPVGVKKISKLLEDIPNKIRNKLGIIPSVEVEERDNLDILRVSVEPQSTPISYNGKYYMRSGSNNFELQGNELVDFFFKKHGRSWDECIEEDANFSDINEDTIEIFKGYARDRLPSISKEEDNKLVLEKLDLISNNKLKRAAILLFGNNPQKFYPAAFLKIGKFLSDTDILTTDIVKGNLFAQLENTLEILRTKYLISHIKYEGIHRREILEYPYRALRESIINALIHRNYLGSSQVQVRVYEDRIIFMNEGKLPPEVPVEKLKTKHLSKPRNTLLANVFYKAGFIENWGRGTLEIINKCLKQGLPEPDFDEEYGAFNVTLYKSIIDEQAPGIRGETVGKTRDKTREKTVEKTVEKIIDFIHENPSISIEELARKTGLTRRGIEWNIKKLRDRGVLKRVGPAKGGHWDFVDKNEIIQKNVKKTVGKSVEETVEETVETTVEKIIDFIHENPSISIEELARKTGLTRRGIEYNIKKLKKNGIIKRVGPKKGGHWEIVGKKSGNK